MKICLVTLGCAKNVVEGESLAALISKHCGELTTDIQAADAAVVHTCSFIADARRESEGVIASLSRLKRRGLLKKIFVTGCLVQEAGNDISRLYPEVDGFIGTGDLGKIARLIDAGGGSYCDRPGGLLEPVSGRILSSALPSAYLRLAEGCDHRCGFCFIPTLRGPYRSRPMANIVREANALAAVGIRELVLIAQDTTFYGRDRYGRFALPELLRRLAAVKDIRWLRLMYAHPASVTRELAEVMACEEKICRYIDMPLQHANARVLSAMKRPHNGLQKLDALKQRMPDIAVRTTFIVGFPGETDRDFRELESVVSGGLFEHVGAFVFSPHAGTPAAVLGRQVPAAVARERLKRLMTAQKKVVAARNRGRRNTRLEVLIESSLGKPGLWRGRARFQAPEIDSAVLVSGSAAPGKFVDVRITGGKGYDLRGETVNV